MDVNGTSNSFSSNHILNGSASGIHLQNSVSCLLTTNTINNNGEYGIVLNGSTQDCLLWVNDLATNNFANAQDDSHSNHWDNETHGNWWDDYPGYDLDLNGIGDTPYAIPGAANAQERYPLMFPLKPDFEAPTIAPPADIGYEVGSWGHRITWRPKDPSPANYFIYCNGTFVETGTWYGPAIAIVVDGLPAGTYHYTLVVYDMYGRVAQDTVIVTVTSGISPTIDSPGDISYEVGVMGYNITWAPSDAFPASYILYRNGIAVEGGSWNGSAITINVEGLPVGSYSYMIVVYDQGSNFVSDTVIVTVTKEANTNSDTAENEVLNDPLVLIGGAILGLGTLLGAALLFIRRRG